MPPKASLSSPNKKNINKAAKSDPFGGMLSLTGTALTTQQLQHEAALDKSSKRNKQEELIGGDDTTQPSQGEQAKIADASREAKTNENENVQEQKQQVEENVDDDNDIVEGEDDNYNNNNNKEEEEILCTNNVGTAADREFDELIGAIEGFLVSDELETSRQDFFNALPNPNSAEFSSMPQQEKYITFKKYVEFLDDQLDKFITAKFPGKNIEELAEMIMERQDEVSMDVLELVSGGEESGLDYESFIQMWDLYGGGQGNDGTTTDRHVDE